MRHFPVMVAETCEFLAIRPEGVYLDVTAGLGGHAMAIASRLTSGFVIAADRDPISLEQAQKNAAEAGLSDRMRFHHCAFSELSAALPRHGVEKADGLLADLGVSFYQLTSPERGFSFQAASRLDMRLDPTSQDMTAEEIVNTQTEAELVETLRLGEVKEVWKIARAIVRRRPIRTAAELASVVERAVPRTRRAYRLHPASLVFLALRRKVNDEEGQLASLLEQIPDLVRAGGRAVTLTYMSLEDRQVKVAFRRMAQEGRARLLTKHVVRPTAEEVRTNAPSRSAMLRAIEIQ
jgi:16S rRNA (cytosine1402-N4)-methyltransferase